MVAAFTADYMEVINCLSVAGGVRSKRIKLPEPESLRDAAAPAEEWRALNLWAKATGSNSHNTDAQYGWHGFMSVTAHVVFFPQTSTSVNIGTVLQYHYVAVYRLEHLISFLALSDS